MTTVSAYDVALDKLQDGYCVACIPAETNTGNPAIYLRFVKPVGPLERGVMFNTDDKIRTRALTGFCYGAHKRLVEAKGSASVGE